MATRTKAVTPVIESNSSSGKSFAPTKFFRLLLIVVLAGVLLFLVAKRFRNRFVVAMVNTTPVTRWQLDQMVFDRYGKSTLDEIVNTTLLNQLARDNNVVVSSDDINTELKSLEDRLGGKEALQQSMQQFGIDSNKLNDEIKAILVQKKLAQKLFQLDVTDDEISKYFTDNKTLFPNQKLADVKDKIKQDLLDQKLQEKFTTWFTEQRQKAKVSLYI